MIDTCKDKKECEKKQYEMKITKIKFWWIISVLIEIIALLLTYKFWGKPAPLENLISIGSGLISIVLALVAIAYSMTESIKNNNKENKVELILDKIKNSVDDLEGVLIKVQRATDSTNDEIKGIKDMIKQYQNFDYNQINEEKEIEKEQEIEINNKSNSENYKNLKVLKGEVYYVDLGKGLGFGGLRPVVIIQNDIANRYSPLVTIIPLSSNVKNRKLPTHISIDLDGRESIAMAELVQPVSKEFIKNYIMTLNDEKIKEIERALNIQFSINI